MKNSIIKVLHAILGYERYLYWFSLFKIKFLKFDKRKKDFLYFTQLIDKDAEVVIAGGCTGITTIPFLATNANRKVHVYEPEATNFKILAKVISHYKYPNIDAHQFGLGNENSTKDFILPVVEGTKKHGIAHVVDESIPEYNHGKISQIEVKRLDDIFLKNHSGNLAMKIVAENFELEIFNGAENLIRKHYPIIYCELWPNEKKLLVLDYIRNLGYQIYFIHEKQLVIYNGSNYSGKHFIFKKDE